VLEPIVASTGNGLDSAIRLGRLALAAALGLMQIKGHAPRGWQSSRGAAAFWLRRMQEAPAMADTIRSADQVVVVRIVCESATAKFA